MYRPVLFVACISVALLALPGYADPAFRAGFAQRDITPTNPTPMWGYGARHDYLSTGTLDPLMCKALVIEAGGKRLALVGMDIGRGPTEAMMQVIRPDIAARAKIDFASIGGSHTHHGPVIELLDAPGMGQGKFDDAVAYAQSLPKMIADTIVEAAENLEEAKIGWHVEENTDVNRNRHSKIEPKPRDPEVAVIRVDKIDGTPLAVLVNFAAHPVLRDIMDRRFSGDWVSVMTAGIEEQFGAPCIFLQGAEGDMSPNTNDQRRGADGFGAAMATFITPMAQAIETAVPAKPEVRGVERQFDFETRINFKDPLIIGTFRTFFFKELLAMAVEFENNRIKPRMSVILLNGELALVTGSGEFFSAHSVRLKEESAAPETLFLGLSNGHHMYFPTEPAVEEGGYGADPSVSWVPPSAGREMIDWALAQISELVAAR